MNVSVPYSHMRGLDYPLIPITLDSKLKTLALVDSGASFSIFKAEVAHGLGINIKKGKRLNIGSVKGGFPIFIHSVRATVASHAFKCKIGFSEEPIANINILGRDNFFGQFSITFNEQKKRMTLFRAGK